jgi:hypothetical protein
MVGTTISIIIHSPVNHLHCSLALPHALFVLSSIFLAFFFFFCKKKKAKRWHCMLNLSHTFSFQFILVFGCVIYVVYMGYFVKNLGFYFVMNLLKIPDPIRLTRPKKPDPNRPIPAGFSHFYYCHGLEIPIPDWHGSGGRTGRNPPEPTRAQP